MCAQEAHRLWLIVAPQWEQPKGPSGVEWYNKLWDSNTTEYYIVKTRMNINYSLIPKCE